MQEPRDQAPASTVGAAAAAAATAAAENQGRRDETTTAANSAAVSSSSSAGSEPLAKKGRTTCHTGQEEGEAATAASAATAATGEKSAGDGVAKTEGKEETGSGDEHDAPPGLVTPEVEEGVDRVAGDEEDEEDEEEFNPYCFIAHLPPYNTVKHHTPEVCWFCARRQRLVC